MERLLYNYNNNKLRLKELKEKIIDSSGDSEQGMPRSTNTSSITEIKAIRLCEDKEILKLEEDIKTVESFLMGVTDRQFLIVELKYFRSDLNDKEIMQILRLKESTFYRDLKRIREA